ncbi:bactofilin family protein [Penaeicola halotolerans]|uniref:bactofilin family protein n=1 Tax=Penaeicola halotolerans TaxID=2793196 RepID=UPI001CF8B849|nr:polymer-forming cytoskeletal protein [Penaeicola halotolerans]
MFKKAKRLDPATNFTILQHAFVLTGDIVSENDIRIEGQINGKVTTTGRIVIGENAQINGDLTAKEIFIHGNVKGQVIALSELVLKNTSKFQGSIFTKLITVENGASLDGRLNTFSEDISDPEEIITMINTQEELKPKKAAVETKPINEGAESVVSAETAVMVW